MTDHWREVPDEDATYWRVACDECGDVVVKASRRNMLLHQAGHARGRHRDVPFFPSYTVTPLVRVPDAETSCPVFVDQSD